VRHILGGVLSRINKLKDWQAAIIFVVIGFGVFFTGLTSPFQGDDSGQIVTNLPVHSISNIKLFFKGGTFYGGSGFVQLIGSYYRPLMTTVYSIIYTIFGPRSFYFHLLQLLICIGSAALLYLVFRYSFKPGLAILLALIFLVHPIDSQVVYGIPEMQDALYFFFGILSFWLLLRFNSVISLWFVASCLFLSFLSKETSILFVVMALLYLLWWDRKRLGPFIVIMIIPSVVYLFLRHNAIGWLPASHNAPIDSLGLAHRLLTTPSIVLFYISKFLFPWELATSYYWIHPVYSFRYFLVPLFIDLSVIGLFIFFGFRIYHKAQKATYYTYLFFALWCSFGMVMLLQIIPLDMTVSETWFYFPMVGLLGMIGTIFKTFPKHIRAEWILVAAIIFSGCLGLRTAIRGLDWRSPYSLTEKDVIASGDDYRAYSILAIDLTNQNNFAAAKVYAERSVSIYPTFSNYANLGVVLTHLGDYSAAASAYHNGLKYGQSSLIYDNLGELTLLYGGYQANLNYLVNTLHLFPRDSPLWMYIAILQDKNNNNEAAQIDIENALRYGNVPQALYDNIINNVPFTITLAGKDISIKR
jgi:hypothetical protein